MTEPTSPERPKPTNRKEKVIIKVPLNMMPILERFYSDVDPTELDKMPKGKKPKNPPSPQNPPGQGKK